MSNKVNQFKVWCMTNGVRQVDLGEKSEVGITTLHNLMNNSDATLKTMEKVAACLREDFGKEITAQEIQDMIKG